VLRLALRLRCAGLLLLASLTWSVSAGTRDDVLALQSSAGDEDQLIILTVNNAATSLGRPGSVPRNYGGGTYSASSSAITTMRRLASQYHLQQVAAWPIAPLRVHCAVFRIPVQQSRDELLQRLAIDHRVVLAQPLNRFSTRAGTYNDPYLEMQRGFRDIDAASAQQWSRGERVRVAVIDTGVDAAHPDFGGRVTVRRNFVDHDAAQFARDRHGTAVAGVISASANNNVGIVGVAPAVEVIALKACWQTAAESDAARCNSLTIAQALVAAMEEQAQVVNLSITGPHDPLLNALVAAGAERGIIYVGAAPHDADAAGFPAGAPGILPVDTAESGLVRSGVLRAPGRDVVTLAPGDRYDFVSGASLATAHVSGAVALLLARAHRMNAATAYDLLLRSESGDPDSGSAAPINICTALAGVLKQPSCLRSTRPASVAQSPAGTG
jgi:hypothetical protein